MAVTKKMPGMKSGGKTKDMTVVPVTKKARTSVNVQKTFPGASKGPSQGTKAVKKGK
jgi:hypothetical protein